jgi:hypothetical protein
MNISNSSYSTLNPRPVQATATPSKNTENTTYIGNICLAKPKRAAIRSGQHRQRPALKDGSAHRICAS